MNEPTCESLWLPPCPVCSWVVFWRPHALDKMEPPGFYLAQATTTRHQQNYYMLRGCSHATNLGDKLGPMRNRLILAVRWRRKVAGMVADLFRRGYTEGQRTEIMLRLGHPSEYPVAPTPLPAPRPVVGAVQFLDLARELRRPYAEG